MEISKFYLHRYWIYILLAGNFLIVFVFYTQPSFTITQVILTNDSLEEESDKEYLISTQKCKIPNLDPWNEEIKPFYKKKKYISCSKSDLLTHLRKNGTHAVLTVNEKAQASYSKKKIQCCYMNVTRKYKETDPDGDINKSKCVDFKKEIAVNHGTVMVTCRTEKDIYTNVHAAVLLDDVIRKKVDFNPTRKRLSVLMIGIDSISRLNFIRTLPRTNIYLAENDWIEYKGYNKIGDNTYPNIMGILTGRNLSSSYGKCCPKDVGKLDACNFIWKDYRNLSYVTAYAEDEAHISTFNYMKKGFVKEPVDYYFRPYMIAALGLKKQRVDGMNYCTGPEMSGERILNLAKDFAVTFRDSATFSLFWMNSFSHNELNSPTRMDTILTQFLEDLAEAKVFDNSMVVFFSDHGMRFGKVRQTRTGWLEERLPFLYFSLPKWFQNEFPKEYGSLKVNSNRLTTPYDMYMTLQDVLVLSGMNYTAKPAEACPNCTSLFREIPLERSCEDAAIERHWCTCTGYESIDCTNDTVVEAANFIVGEINDKLAASKQAKKCAKFKLSKVVSSSISNGNSKWYDNDTYLLLIVKTEPEAVFESTLNVALNDTEASFRTEGGVSRVDLYQDHSRCVDSADLKLFCYCK